MRHRSGALPARRNGRSAALGVHHVAEQLPGLALEALQLHRLDRVEVGGAGADEDAWQQQRHAKIVEGDAELEARVRGEGYRATVERVVVIDVAGFDWNCSQHITPRWTQEEIEEGLRKP